MPTPAPLQRFVDDALTHAPRWLSDVSQDALQALLDGHNPALVSQPREAVGQAVTALQDASRRLIDGFVIELRVRIDEAASDARGHAARTLSNDIDSWSLVDADEAEQDIEVLRAIQLAENQSEAELQELLARTSTLRGDTAVRSDANPIRPEVIARALWSSIQTLGLPGPARLALMRAISQPLARRLKAVYSDALKQLEAWGVRPAAYRAVQAPSAGREADPPHSGFDVTRPGAFDELRTTAGRGHRAGPLSGVAAGNTSPQGGHWDRVSGELLQLHPAEAGSPAHAVHTPHAPLSAQALLAQLFDKIFADARLLPEVRNVLARLQPGVLQLAQADPRLLDDYQHPAWQLLNAIASHTIGYDNADDPRLHTFLVGIDLPLEALAQQPQASLNTYEHALQQVRNLIDEQLRVERGLLSGLIDKLHLAAARNQIAPIVHQEIVALLAGVEMDDDLRRFLYGPWVQAAATRAATNGEAGAQPFLDAIDLLVQTLIPPHSVSERSQLLQRIPKVVRLLREGMAHTRIGEGERDALLGALMARHHELLARPLGADPAAAPGEPSPEDIMRRLRDEPAYAPASTRSGSNTVLDIASLDTVPAALLDQVRPASVTPWLDTAMPGAWCRICAQGRWLRLRLIWQSDDHSQWVFSGPSSGQGQAFTQRALLRLCLEGLALPLEPRNVVERAVDALLADIAQRSATPVAAP